MVWFLLQTYFLSCLLKGLFLLFIFLPSTSALRSPKLLLLRIIISLRKGSVQKNQGRGEEGDRKIAIWTLQNQLFLLPITFWRCKTCTRCQSGLQLAHPCLPLPPTSRARGERSQEQNKSIGLVRKGAVILLSKSWAVIIYDRHGFSGQCLGFCILSKATCVAQVLEHLWLVRRWSAGGHQGAPWAVQREMRAGLYPNENIAPRASASSLLLAWPTAQWCLHVAPSQGNSSGHPPLSHSPWCQGQFLLGIRA